MLMRQLCMIKSVVVCIHACLHTHASYRNVRSGIIHPDCIHTQPLQRHYRCTYDELICTFRVDHPLCAVLLVHQASLTKCGPAC